MTPNPYQQVERSLTNPFLRPPLRPGTGTSESASFHSIDNRNEPEPEPIDTETTVPYKIKPETETQLLNPEPESESELEREPTMVMADTAPTAPPMDVDHEGKSYLKKPEPFNGNRQKVDDFIYACNLFFEGSSNKDFPTDKQKIIFILSYISEGEAQWWKKNYIKMMIKQADGSYTWPTKAMFLTAFKATFLNEDKKEESIWKLNHISQGNRTAEEYVNEFRLTVSKVGLTTDNNMIVRTFWKGLNWALATRILYLTKNRMLLKIRLPRKDGTPSLSNSIEFTRTMSKLSMNNQTNQWDNNRLSQTNSDKHMDKDINQDQHINKETTRGTINPNMIRTPWTSMLSPRLSTWWAMKNKANT